MPMRGTGKRAKYRARARSPSILAGFRSTEGLGSCLGVGAARSPTGPLPTTWNRSLLTRPVNGSRATRSPRHPQPFRAPRPSNPVDRRRFLKSLSPRHVECGVIRDKMAKYDESPVPRGTSRRWEVLMSDDSSGPQTVAERRTAKDVRAEHRVLLSFSVADLGAMPLVSENTRLVRGGWYLDLHDPARADFIASGDEAVEPGQHVLARKEVSAELWDELLRACDGVLGRPSMRRLRTAV